MARASRISAALASPAHFLGAAFRDDRAVRVGEVDPNPEPSRGMACERAQNSGILSEEQPAVGRTPIPRTVEPNSDSHASRDTAWRCG